MKPVALHLATSLNFCGVETHLALIAAHGGTRFEHRFLALDRGGSAEQAISATGATVSCLGIDPWKSPLDCVRTLRRHLQDASPAVVHAHGSEANLFGLWTAKSADVPVRIGEEIGLPDHRLRARLALRAAYRAADRVIGVSDAVRDFLVSSGEVPKSRALRIYNPVRETGSQASPRLEGQPLRIAFLGRLEPTKNPRPLVEAIVALAEGGMPVELTMIGDGSLRDELELQAADCPAVTFAGFQAEPGPLLARHHLLVQPSISEGFGIALVEGMSAGLPGLVTAVGGMPEIVQDGVNGWILAGNDASAIADAIVRIERLDGAALAEVGRSARQSVAGRFGIGRYMDQIEALYSDLGAE